MTQKIIFTGTTRTTGGPNGSARSSDGRFDFQLPEPHPAAEQLFAAAWSACFIGAIGLVAGQRKIALPQSPAIEATIEVLHGEAGFFLKARLDVEVPGVDRADAAALVEAAHAICPYSKAIHGNVDVEVNLV